MLIKKPNGHHYSAQRKVFSFINCLILKISALRIYRRFLSLGDTQLMHCFFVVWSNSWIPLTSKYIICVSISIIIFLPTIAVLCMKLGVFVIQQKIFTHASYGRYRLLSEYVRGGFVVVSIKSHLVAHWTLISLLLDRVGAQVRCHHRLSIYRNMLENRYL